MVPSVCKPHVWSEPIVTALNLPLGASTPLPWFQPQQVAVWSVRNPHDL